MCGCSGSFLRNSRGGSLRPSGFAPAFGRVVGRFATGSKRPEAKASGYREATLCLEASLGLPSLRVNEPKRQTRDMGDPEVFELVPADLARESLRPLGFARA